MESTKGLVGRRICGCVKFIVGALIIITAALGLESGVVDIISFLIGVFVILTGLLGVASKTTGMIIAYMVTSIISSLYFGYASIVSLLVILEYRYWDTRFGFRGLSSYDIILIVAVVIFIIAFIVSVSGVILSTLPWCGNIQGQNRAQQYSNGRPSPTAPNVDAGPPNSSGCSSNAYIHGGYTDLAVYQPQHAGAPTPSHNNSMNCINTTQTMQYGNMIAGGDGLSGCSYINTAYEGSTQNQRYIHGSMSAGAVGLPSYNKSETCV